MKNLFLLICTLLLGANIATSQTMTFAGGPSEPGFTFNNWASGGGTIWHANLATPTTCSVNTGTWNFISFDVGPWLGVNTYTVSSNLGDSFTYSGNTAATHTLNWMGVTTVTFTRDFGSGAAADHDNFVYTLPPPCTDPTIPTITSTPSTICSGGSSTLTWTGSLNDATAWHVYTTACGVTQLTSTTSNSLVVSPGFNTTYYIRGEDGAGCVDESLGSCGTASITVNPLDNASFSYSASSYCVDNADPTPTITGLGGGGFTSSPVGLSINPSTGAIDVSLSTPNTYTVTYTTTGACPNSSNVAVTINGLDDAGFNYSASAYCVNDSDPTPTITGLGGGGFTSSPGGLSINPSTGAIDVSLSTPNTYTVTYTTTGTCPNSSNVAVTINGLDNAGFNYSASAYCVNDSDPTPTITGLVGGGFTSSPAGLAINPSTGAIDVSLSTPSIYTVTYTTTGICPNSSNANVTINGLDDASFFYGASTYCLGEADPTPTITGLGGGGFSSTPAGLNINPSTGFINIGLSVPNTYTITYTTTGVCPNSSNVGLTIGTPPTTPSVVSPMTICPGDDIILSATGSGAGSLIFYDNTPAVIGVVPMPPATGTLNLGALPIGSYSFGATESNGACQSLPATIDITVGDIIPPTAVCQNITVYLDGSGNVSIVATDLDGGSTDNCSGLTLSASQTAFTCANIGANNVTFTATDGNANSANCVSVVTVADTISPSTTCPGNQIENFDASCQFTVPDYTSLVTATDNCTGSPIVTQSPLPSTVISGITTVTMTSDDGNGNTSQCTFDIVPNDATPPTAVCQNINVYLDGSGNATIVASDLDGGSTDNCSSVLFSSSQTAFTCADIGPNNVTLTVSDGVNNSNCIAVVTVLDTISPTITCPANVVASNDPGTCVATGVALGTPTTGDNCSVASTADDGLVTYPLGVTNVTWTVTDVSGNTATCIQTVTVNDNEAPVADIPVLADINGVCEITSLTDPTATDNCSAVTVTNDATLPITLSSTITWTYEDASGNSSTQTQNVVLTDVTDPTASNPTNLMVECLGDAIIDITVVTDAMDDCTVTPIVTWVNDVSDGLSCPETVTRTYNVADESGNNIDVVQTIIVNDVTPPTAPNPGTMSVQCMDNFPSPNIMEVTGEMDNCGSVPTVTYIGEVSDGLSCPETFTRTYRITDDCGNFTDVIQLILVNDVSVPVPVLASLPNETYSCSVEPTAPIAIDNCSGTITAVADVPLPITTLGTSTITWTFTDDCGNQATQTQVVDILGIDATTYMATDGTTIVANNFNPGVVTYQWIDCITDQIIPGETNHNYTPTYGSDFAVIVTEGGCSDTSDCVNSVVGLDDLTLPKLILYPNPTHGVFNILFDGEIESIEVMDMLGRVIDLPINIQESQVDATILEDGKYIIRIKTVKDLFVVEEFVIQK